MGNIVTHNGHQTLNATQYIAAQPHSENMISERTALPLPPALGNETKFEMEIYARFMRHLRNVPNSKMEIKILSSIHFTADMMDVADELVAKTLVDLGLRAPRRAFPVAFLDFSDKALQRRVWDCGPAPAPLAALRDHWDKIGEDRFSGAVRNHYAIFNEGLYNKA